MAGFGRSQSGGTSKIGVPHPLAFHNKPANPVLIPECNGYSGKSDDISMNITLIQCNIRGDPLARLGKGCVLWKLLDSHDLTLLLLTGTKRKRKDIPLLREYGLFCMIPIRASSGGIALYD